MSPRPSQPLLHVVLLMVSLLVDGTVLGRGVEIQGGRGESIHVQEAPDFGDDMIRCRLCDIVVDQTVRHLYSEHRRCLRAAAPSQEHDVRSDSIQEMEGGKVCPLWPASNEVQEWASSICSERVLDWFPALEEQYPPDDRLPHERLEGGDVRHEEDLEIVADDGSGDAPSSWPAHFPAVPPQHRFIVTATCNRIFFPTNAPRADSAERLLREAAAALSIDGTHVHSRDRLYRMGILPLQESRCTGECGAIPRSRQEPQRIRGFSMSMKRLK